MIFIKTLLCLMLMAFTGYPQSTKDSLTDKLNAYLKKSDLPGFAVVILENGKPVYQQGFGYADLKTKRLYSPETIQTIGSVSKTFVAVALMKAIEMNYFTLDTDINDILPFKVINPYYPDAIIRVRDLCTHTSGIIDDQVIYNRAYRFEKSGDLDQTLAKFMTDQNYSSDLKDTTLGGFLKAYLNPEGTLYSDKNFYKSKPGKRASYSNIGSALAAYMIEVSSGMTFDTFSDKYVLKPLKMTSSSWLFADQDKSKYALPYFNNGTAFPFYTITTYPDGGLRSSALDLSKYVSAMMSALNGHSKLLKKNTTDEMFRPIFRAETLPENMSLRTRNKGVFWNIYNDGFIGHDGDDPGVCANILFNINKGIVFICNRYIEDRTELLNLLKAY